MVDQSTVTDSLLLRFVRIGRSCPEDIDISDERDDDLFVVMNMGRMRSFAFGKNGVVAVQRREVWRRTQEDAVA